MIRIVSSSRWPLRHSLGFVRNMSGTDRVVRSRTDGQRDIIAVIGTTGVGKSQLAVDLAQYIQTKKPAGVNDATILSADSMQLYQGLPLITNQVTDEEAGGIEHWGINVVRPGQGGPWDVGKWCSEALEKVRSDRIIHTGESRKFDVIIVP
jgi:tRNA dimethylallyltransferase